ncbi:DUF6656 family protein [Pseudorhizobium flavum]|uniref:Uncharacterized protein n=1 Tax=Pseudorhizobium flavum TaxID=1335061 RepID=A0A7W9YWF3_9HYPH|nr:DUF6656 family protein [Pseudorhizobium flavum]MBB6179650.1 hypothetical protein [Pseudorhizobium flavum]CAD6596315.1 hypothetical protein RFYW14_00267 [Pseudorhizobium flavum]
MSISTASKLTYADRFGDDISKTVRQHALSLASSRTDQANVSARYTRWFHGEDQPEPISTSKRKFRSISAGMAAKQIAEITRGNLAILGNDAHSLFSSRLPANHKMTKSVRSSVLPSAPHLGACRFGQVTVDEQSTHRTMLQFYIANFDAALDTSNFEGFYKPNNRNFDQIFFGIHLMVDRNGNAIGFDHSRGEQAVAFRTKDLTTALYNIASSSTGLTVAALRARAKPAGAVQVLSS